MAQQDASYPAHAAFDCFVQAQTCKDVLQSFSVLCHHLEVDPWDHRRFYSKLKERLNYWKAKALWAKLDKRCAHPDYGQGKACEGNKCLVLGAGPCGLRTAIELAQLGAQVVLLEKREAFSRNNVLHLWPYTIHDLRGLAAKKFYGRFCSGSLDHISIRQLQLILLKVALLLGVEVHIGVEYKGLLEPQVNGKEVTGWRAELWPETHPSRSFQFDVLISAGGGRFVPKGFRRKELRGKLAIGITANFFNHRTAAEAQVAEISGVARIYNQKFFQQLHNETGIDLENIVYYKDDTHYFVMTAKKKSLLDKGVIKQDHSDAERLLSPGNVDQDSLLRYACDAAQFSTGHQLPGLKLACDDAGRPDVAMFDFTCMYRAENASMVHERKGRRLLVGLVGDCLVEPFWPLGTGIARGFLAAFDAAWMVRSWGLGMAPLEVLAERESVYQLLSQTTPDNTSKNYGAYSINPTTRYPNINLSSIKANQVRHLYNTEDYTDTHKTFKKNKARASCLRQDSVGSCEDLLSWCQQNTTGYRWVTVTDLTESWRSGLALCALIHHFRPSFLDFASLDESDPVCNNQLAFDLAEKMLGIPPIMSAADMLAHGQPDKLSMVLYLTQFYNVFTGRVPPADQEEVPASKKSLSLPSTQSVVLFLTKLKHGSLQRRKEKLSTEQGSRGQQMGGEEDDNPASPLSSPMLPLGTSETCYFCTQRVYVLERVSAESKFFHRSCFTCHQCGATLRLGSYTFNQANGKFFCVQHSEESPLKMGEEGAGHPQPESPNKGVPEKHAQTTLGPMEKNYENEHSRPSSDLKEEEQTSGPTLNVEHHEEPSGLAMEHQDCEEQPVSSPEELPHESPSQCLADAGPDPDSELRPCKLAEGRQKPSQEADPSGVSPDKPNEALSQERRPVPAPRSVHQALQVKADTDCGSRDATPSTPPVPKPRNISKIPTTPFLVTPDNPALPNHQEEDEQDEEEDVEEETGECGDTSTDSRPKQPLRKLQLTEEERSQLVNFDSDSEALPVAQPVPEKPPRTLLDADADQARGTWSNSQTASYREQKNRRSFRRKEELVAKAQAQVQAHNPKARSKFSPWNLSSPRLAREHRFGPAWSHVVRSGATSQPDIKVSDMDGGDDDEDDDDENALCVDDATDLFDETKVPSDPVEAQKMDLLRMRTLERHAKLCELQRFHKAQSIQRRLEEIEVTFKELEEKGVVLERALRGDAATGSDASSDMIGQWIHLVHEKNELVSEESDLMVASRQLELEDEQSTLEAELRRYIEMDESEKTAEQRAQEELVLQQMLGVVDMRNSLVAFLEEQRLKEMNEELQSVSVVEPKRPGSEQTQVRWA